MIWPLAVPLRVPHEVAVHVAAQSDVLEMSLKLPRPSEVGIEAALQATIEFSRALRARVEAEGAPRV